MAEWTPERIEAERRRLRRWGFWLVGLLLVGFFGLLRYNYPTVRLPSGRVVGVIFEGRRYSSSGRAAVFEFLSDATSVEGAEREVLEVAPYATALAEEQGDSVLYLTATRHWFRYGLFTLGTRYHFRLHRDDDDWRLECLAALRAGADGSLAACPTVRPITLPKA
jgi:hypothetical protein